MLKNYLFITLILLLLMGTDAIAQGISTESGLTPSQGRLLVRMQYRVMGMENETTKINMHMVPLVIGYGIDSRFSVILRSTYTRKFSPNNSNVQKGMNDLFVLSKFKLFRKNAPKYSLGFASFIASNIPVGSREVSDRTWNPIVGLNISYKPRYLSLDFSTSYTFNDLQKKVTPYSSKTYAANLAFSGKLPLNSKASKILSPVVEFNYSKTGKNTDANFNKFLFLSGGVSFIYTSFTMEALYQLPVYEFEKIGQMHQIPRWIFGLKHMF